MRHLERMVLLLLLATIVASVAPTSSGAPSLAPVLQCLSFPAALPPPVNRVEVRQAIAFALDRAAIAALLPPAVPAVGLTHPRLLGYNPQVRGHMYDPERAKALLAEPAGLRVRY